jgi:hypothetical protein
METGTNIEGKCGLENDQQKGQQGHGFGAKTAETINAYQQMAWTVQLSVK